jgi:hypothetical protein
MLKLTLFWAVVYYVFAHLVRRYLTTPIQVHGLVHCFIATVWTSHILLQINTPIFSYDALYQIMLYFPDSLQNSGMWAMTHSLGYFIADSVDIGICKDPKRNVYLFHHYCSIIVLSMACMSTPPRFAMVYLVCAAELGATWHDLRYISRVFQVLETPAALAYHLVYGGTRTLVTAQLPYIFFKILSTGKLFQWQDSFILLFVTAVTVQNLLWWHKNITKDIKKLIAPLSIPHSKKTSSFTSNFVSSSPQRAPKQVNLTNVTLKSSQLPTRASSAAA